VARIGGCAACGWRRDPVPRRQRGVMAEPRRVQRSRAKGWRMPQGTVYVGAPTIFGNPFLGPKAAIRYRDWLLWKVGPKKFYEFERRPFYLHHDRKRVLDNLHKLRGRSLSCWCALDKPCHSDVLLWIANAPLKCEA
jgi:hypothetical protein